MGRAAGRGGIPTGVACLGRVIDVQTILTIQWNLLVGHPELLPSTANVDVDMLDTRSEKINLDVDANRWKFALGMKRFG